MVLCAVLRSDAMGDQSELDVGSISAGLESAKVILELAKGAQEPREELRRLIGRGRGCPAGS
jgi:hypothetical protein